jgi:uncharacterized protein YgfB (UPF0149 family)
MRRKILSILTITLFCFLSGVSIFAQNSNADTVSEQIKNELAKETAVTLQELNNLDYHIKGMLSKGVKEEDVKNVIIDFSNSGLNGNDLQSATSYVNQLIGDGLSPKEATTIVSRAAQEAKAQGLQGADFSARIGEKVKQQKLIIDQIKERLNKK